MTSPAIVVLNAFLDSSDLPKEGLSGLLWKFLWRDALIRRTICYTAEMQYTTVLRTVILVVCFFIIVYYPDAILSCLIVAEYVLPMYKAVNVIFE